MKKEFLGYYEASGAEIDSTWGEGLFVFDANSLLNLYRYTESTRQDFLLVLEKLKSRLFMPHQVGLEFHNNRLNVIETQQKAYTVLLKTFEEISNNSIEGLFAQFQRHPSIDLSRLRKLQKEFTNKLTSELDRQKKKHPDFVTSHDILDKLTDLFSGKVGVDFSKDELKKIYIEGKERYEQLIPPGYKDLEKKKNKSEKNIYGDLIVWKQIIAHIKKEKKKVVLITDDRKEDWWTIENGKTIRAREELIKEFFEQTNIRILIYNTDNFLQYAKERGILSTIKETSINEIKEVRNFDETLNNTNKPSVNNFYWDGNGKKVTFYNDFNSTINKFLESVEGYRQQKEIFYNSSLYNIDPDDIYRKVITRFPTSEDSQEAIIATSIKASSENDKPDNNAEND